jgi:hypothetical protein
MCADFWLKDGLVYEQPVVQYTYNTIFQAVATNTQTNTLSHLYYSSNKQLNTLNNQNLRVGTLSSAELDSNGDGQTDTIEMNFLLPLSAYEQVQSIVCLTVFNVRLSAKAKYTFESATLMKYESALPLQSVYMEGNLMVEQDMSLYTKGGYGSFHECIQCAIVCSPVVLLFYQICLAG